MKMDMISISDVSSLKCPSRFDMGPMPYVNN